MIEVVLKPCPWCKETPTLVLPYMSKQTWQWTIECKNTKCSVQPLSKHVSVRNTAKTNFSPLISKLAKLADIWNIGNPIKAYEMKQVDLSKIGIKLNFPFRITARD